MRGVRTRERSEPGGRVTVTVSGEGEAREVPKDVQAGIEWLYGRDELLRRIAEEDQRHAALCDAITRDIGLIERARRCPPPRTID